MKRSDEFPTVALIRTCFRCGSEFRAHSGRVCSGCRKPRCRNREYSRGGSLTLREAQIAAMVCEAKLNKEIAFELRLTEGTIKEYLYRMFRKLGVKNRTELAIWTVRNAAVGLLDTVGAAEGPQMARRGDQPTRFTIADSLFAPR